MTDTTQDLIQLVHTNLDTYAQQYNTSAGRSGQHTANAKAQGMINMMTNYCFPEEKREWYKIGFQKYYNNQKKEE